MTDETLTKKKKIIFTLFLKLQLTSPTKCKVKTINVFILLFILIVKSRLIISFDYLLNNFDVCSVKRAFLPTVILVRLLAL